MILSNDSLAAKLSVLFGGGGGGGNGKSYARFFVTSTTYDGNLGGLAGADAKCQARATAASLGGTWKAILSDSTTNAYARMKFRTKPVYDLAGRLLWNPSKEISYFNGANAIVYPPPFSAPGGMDGYTVLATYPYTTELGSTTSSAEVWTGSSHKGEVVAGYHCTDWSSTAGTAWVGNTGFVTTSWMYYTTRACSTTYRLYCLEDE